MNTYIFANYFIKTSLRGITKQSFIKDSFSRIFGIGMTCIFNRYVCGFSFYFLRKILIVVFLLCAMFRVSYSQISFKPDSFDFESSSSMLEDYLNFLMNQKIDTILVIETSKGTAVEYSNFKNFLFVKNGVAYYSFYSNYTIPTKNTKKFISLQNVKLDQKSNTTLADIFSNIEKWSPRLQEKEKKPFKKAWKKHKWRNLYLFGYGTNPTCTTPVKNAYCLLNRAYGMTKLSKWCTLHHQKKIAQKTIRLFDLKINKIIEKVK